MKILACTSIRSDYDLMSSLYALLDKDDGVDLRLLVSGAHLSKQHGYTIDQIKNDGFNILASLETVLSSDSSASRVKSASLLLQGSIELIDQFQPDLIVFSGDREDVLVYAMIGGYLSIPTVHFYAGDHVTDGYIDNPIRHATSKIASAHCVTLPEHKQRLIRMGEKPERVCVTGSLSLDRFIAYKSLSRQTLSEKLKTDIIFSDFAIVIFHPVTSELDQVGIYFENILLSLLDRNIPAFISYPNVDPGSYGLHDVIKRYEWNSDFFFYENLDREYFLSIYKYANFMIGNSSSGICEAASLRIPAINVGDRQTGRFADENVVFCGADKISIKQALTKIFSDDFQERLKTVQNSYGDGNGVNIAYEFIKGTDFHKLLEKKEDPLEVLIE